MSKGHHELVAPLFVYLPSGAKFQLNLNVYRNAHYHTLNAAKVAFSNVMRESIQELPVMEKVVIRYFLYPGSHRLCDVANICSVVDKFLSDALVTAKKVEDDNYSIVPGVSYEFGAVDKTNPRVVIYIDEI